MDYDEFSKLYLKTHNGKSIIQVQRAAGLKGILRLIIPELQIERYTYAAAHVTDTHGNITRQEAESFIKDASFTLIRYNGKSVNCFSDNRAAYVDTEDKIIRTAFRASQYDEKITTIKEAIDNVLGERH